MQFNSIPFLLFLLIVVILYYLIPQKYKKPFLLLSSYYFYFSAKPEYLVLLLASTAFNYLTAFLLETKQSRKVILICNLILNLGILFGFKYLNFVSSQLNSFFSQFSLNLHIPAYSIILPIGISFYTIMAIGYILDIYWGDRKRDKNYILFSLYMAFFPQILSGPIGRAKKLIPQLSAKPVFRYINFSNGFRLMLWGFFKKLVITDGIKMIFCIEYSKSLDSMLRAIKIVVISCEIGCHPICLGIVIETYAGIDITVFHQSGADSGVINGNIRVFKCAVGYAAGIIIQVIDAFGKRILKIAVADNGIVAGMLPDANPAAFDYQI